MRYCLHATVEVLTTRRHMPAMAAFAAYADDLPRVLITISARHRRATTTVTARNGAPGPDGPFGAQGSSAIVIDANLDEALKWAQTPCQRWGSVEIRPVARRYAPGQGGTTPFALPGRRQSYGRLPALLAAPGRHRGRRDGGRCHGAGVDPWPWTSDSRRPGCWSSRATGSATREVGGQEAKRPLAETDWGSDHR